MVGALTGIQNFFGSIGGLLAPIVTGYIVSATGSFTASFVVAGGMALFGAISYVFIVSPQPGLRAASAPRSSLELSSTRKSE